MENKNSLNTIEERLTKLEEKFILDEKKKKKPYSSKTYTTGDPDLNIAHFNKMMGTGKGSYLNGTIEPDPSKINAAAEKAAKDIGTIAAPSPDGSSSISTGGEGGDSGASSGGEGGGCCESLLEQKLFIAKVGEYVDMPDFIQLLPSTDVSQVVSSISPEQKFEIGYATPIYFYKKLFDKFTLVKCTQMEGYTGVDYREASVKDVGINQQRINNANTQISNPEEETDYGVDFNKENSKVKSKVDGMRKDYADINKTVKQADQEIYERDPSTGRKVKDANGNPIVKETVKDLKTILFYPTPGSSPKVKYYIDLKDGKGFKEISREVLVDIIYEKVLEVIKRDVANRTISNTEDLTDVELKFLHDVRVKAQHVIDSDAKTIDNSVLSDGEYSNADRKYDKPSVRALYTNQLYYINVPKTKEKLGNKLFEELQLQEAKRYVRRYYIRPQDIFCSNKDEIIKALIDIGNENCSVYTLINLGDDKDVNKLTNDDIIYYYDDGILYDKNRVKVMDYDLYIKHEEKRDDINPDQVSDKTFNDVYDDRMTQNTIVEEIEPKHDLDLNFPDVNIYGESLKEGKEVDGVCCICGEEIDGYGNNPEPYKHEGRCCDACNYKFVIPARLEQMNNREEN